ncbi:MAG: BtaA family protein [Verrucomicrobia bacterium]|nr:MAG: BtaA family protein [Verrucomicrobiota bacterium]
MTPQTHPIHDAIFKRVHGSNLVYNTCWEDPRLDRQMLNLQPDSRLVMITSAGCNALDYALDEPAQIHAVDMNPRQNALLELKIAMILRDDFEDLLRVFGQGVHAEFSTLLGRMTGLLKPDTQRYWESKSHYFRSTPMNPSFYYRGTAGQMAWLALQVFKNTSSKVRDYLAALQHVTCLEDQHALYQAVRPALWNGVVTWLMRQPMAMTMLGVPQSQIHLIESQFEGGITGYLQSKMEHVFTKVLYADNYFWRVYLTGCYTRDCCPNYLLERNQAALQGSVRRITTHNTTIANFLREHPGHYSHYVLLDHQDWLAAHQPEALAEEWRLILENSQPGTCILMRSASPEIHFIPEFARRRLHLDCHTATSLHAQDRVGTYGSTLLAHITP